MPEENKSPAPMVYASADQISQIITAKQGTTVVIGRVLREEERYRREQVLLELLSSQPE